MAKLNYEITNRGIKSTHNSTGDDSYAYTVWDIQETRTGSHGTVGIWLNGGLLAYTYMNLRRGEDQTRLINKCWSKVGEFNQAFYSKEQMDSRIALICLEAPEVWQERIQPVAHGGAQDGNLLNFPLKPFVVQGGGTIMFGPPGTGKSWILLLMAQCINHGLNDLWKTTQAKVLYINLERSRESMERRMIGVNMALDQEEGTTLDFLHGRGLGLSEMEHTIRRFVAHHGYSVVMLDSISRTGGASSLIEDTTANKIINLLNNLCPTWMAIGHTPRADADHIYGSHMFDAGIDVGVRLLSQEVDDGLGIGLIVTKANDFKKPKPQAIKLQFAEDDGPIIGAHHARIEDFPDLVVGQPRTRRQQIEDILKHGAQTVRAINDELNIDERNIYKILRSGGFTNLGSGKYGVSSVSK